MQKILLGDEIIEFKRFESVFRFTWKPKNFDNYSSLACFKKVTELLDHPV